MVPARVTLWLRRLRQKMAVNAYLGMVDGLNATSNLLYPPSCTFCGAELLAESPNSICRWCRESLVATEQESCRHCASPLPLHWGDLDSCPRCCKRRYFFHRSESLGLYRSEMRRAVRQMKRPAFEPLTYAMGLLLADRVRRRYATEDLDWVVPVPMHWWRRLKRGTHPAALIARAVAQTLRIPAAPHLLVCRRKTLKQGTLRPVERARNVRNAFRVSTGYDINDAHVLVVDDIMTTGATVSEAARVLRQAGARLVSVAVVARGTGA